MSTDNQPRKHTSILTVLGSSGEYVLLSNQQSQIIVHMELTYAQ